MNSLRERINNAQATLEAGEAKRAFSWVPHVSYPLIAVGQQGVKFSIHAFDSMEIAKKHADLTRACVYHSAQVKRIVHGQCYLHPQRLQPAYIGGRQ